MRCPAPQLYSHHVLEELAAHGGEGGEGGAAKRPRTLPSFWAAKAALERQRQRQREGQPRKRKQRDGAGGGGQAEGEGGDADGESASEEQSDFRCAAHAAPTLHGCTHPCRRLACSGAFPRALPCALACAHPAPPCSELDRQAAALALLAEEVGAQLSPRSRQAYERIEREFDRLIARVSGAGPGSQCRPGRAACALTDGASGRASGADAHTGLPSACSSTAAGILARSLPLTHCAGLCWLPVVCSIWQARQEVETAEALAALPDLPKGAPAAEGWTAWWAAWLLSGRVPAGPLA